jgi:DNA-binding beta-propeller fold protein YncE
MRIPTKLFLSLLLLISFAAFFGCGAHRSKWVYDKTIKLENSNPVGITSVGDNLFISDVKNNRLIEIDKEGKIINEIKNLKRPMHISSYDNKIYIPEYLNDSIKVFANNELHNMDLSIHPDAPSGISINGDTILVADFYNHRVILQIGSTAKTIGKKGHAAGELFYPTDVQLVNGLIYVADAYNNRVQVFDYKGNSLQIIGDKEKISVATGIEVSDANIFVTDFGGNRVLIYNMEGDLTAEFNGSFNKPTDITYSNNAIYVTNYDDNTVSVINLSK